MECHPCWWETNKRPQDIGAHTQSQHFGVRKQNLLPPPPPIRPHPHASQAVASKTHQSLGRNLTGHLSTPGCTRGILTSSFILLNLFNQCARGGRTDFWISSRRKKKFTKIYNQCWSVWLLVWNLPFLCHLLQGHDTQVGQHLFLFHLNWTFSLFRDWSWHYYSMPLCGSQHG